MLKRELTSLALWAGTYAIAVGFIIISGVFFINLVSNQNSADLASYYANSVNLFGLICPALAARALAEERSSGMLMTSLAWPVPRSVIVGAKFIANTLLCWLLVSVAWIYYRQLDNYANPDLARAFGGWFGMLLIVALFNAVSLAICARTATAVSGFFLSFVFLLFLLIIKFMPGSFRDKLEDFGPIGHLDPMLRGIVYYSDVVYFLVLTAVGIALATYALTRRRSGTDRVLLARRAAAVGGTVALILATPGIAKAADGEIDFTPQKRETLSDASKEVVKKIGNVPITITAFSQSISPEAAEIRTTVRKYKAAGANIKEEIVDPDVSPARATGSGIVDYDTYLLQVGERKMEIDDLIESTVTSGISLLAQTNPPAACFVQGHGERVHTSPDPDGMTAFAARLRIAGYDPKQIFLEADGFQELLKDCKVVIVMGARSLLRPAEMKTLEEYSKSNGRLIIAADSIRNPTQDSAIVKQWNDFLKPWGVRFSEEPIRDPQSLADDRNAIVSSRYPTANPVVDILDADDTPVVFANTLAIEKLEDAPEEGPQFTKLVDSSQKSYKVSDPGVKEKKIKGTEGEHTMAALLVQSNLRGINQDAELTSARIGLLGSSDIATNQYQNAFGNQELFMRMVQYIAEDDAIVSAYRDPGANSEFKVTGEQRRTLIKKTVVMPALAALVFIPFVLWRLKRG
ncbi:MAG: Gldg family protein [Sporichthyaceae bacterium]